MKNPLTPAGIEPAAFRFVAQHLNHSVTAVYVARDWVKNKDVAEDGRYPRTRFPLRISGIRSRSGASLMAMQVIMDC